MKVLFCLLNFGSYRKFESVIRELACRGHHVHLAAEKGEHDRSREAVETLASEYSTITIGRLPSREQDDYFQLAPRLHLGFDYLRYLEPVYRNMPGLRMRSEDRVSVGLLRVLSVPGMSTRPGRVLVSSVLRSLERAIPPSAQIERYLLDEQPDVVLITPLIGVVASSQLDYLATAKRLGIPTGFCVWSWDNLSSKALIRDTPDRVFVWNETQKEEAVQLHRIPAASVAVTGAQCFDQWFGRPPSRSREQFCHDVGLSADQPYILYAGSTMVWKSPPEAEFVVRWLRHIRRSANAALRNVSILIRPHPQRVNEWKHVDVSGFERIAFSGMAAPGTGDSPNSGARGDSPADYYDALFHSAAVVGINTSAFIEAGIVGRPVCAILAEEFSGTQAGTIHFRYLTDIGGGVVQAGRAFDEHEVQLVEALEGRSRHGERQQRFLEAFVRPHGLNVAATPIFVDAVEKLAQCKGEPAPRPFRAPRLAGAVLHTLAVATRDGRGKQLLMNNSELTTAKINETPKTPYRQKVVSRATKRLKRTRNWVIRASRRVSRARKTVSKTWRRAVALALGVARGGPDSVSPRHTSREDSSGQRAGASVPSADCLVVSYHYVRDTRLSRFHRLNALSPVAFASQLSTLKHACDVLDPATLLTSMDKAHTLQALSAVLTFDDGLIDHYTTVFPLLRAHGLRGMFFVSPTNSDEHPRVLNVQKVQLLLAIMGGEALLRELDALVARAGFVRPTQPAHPVLYRYDTAADRQVKQLLNYDLPYEIADDVLRTLFTRHVGDEKEMAQELYLTLDMIREMSSAGMVFGFHTRHHRVLSRLSVRAQRAEIDGGVQWIRDLTGQRAVPFCYPHGHAHVYTTETVDIVRAAGYAMAFTAVRGPATFGTHSWFEIPRYDTRDLDAALGVQHPAASVAHASADGAFSRA